MHKYHVTQGVYVVDIPELELTVLCGCPADVVKHLTRRGLINTTEINGVVFEKGPNAILLSDTSVQNGQLCNLAEFPILHMLYRQGMIIPGHPNNSGRKPILMGSPEQLGSQLRYIHRGNYGLVSVEELVDAGVDRHYAEELMRIKLKFAFGRILPPEEFVECHPIEDEAVEISPGLQITRVALNQFEFSYKTERIMVNLSVATDSGYPCPYPLNNVFTDRHYFSVVHSGDGDGWDYNKPALGSVLIHQGRVYLIDAGPNIEQTLNSLGIGRKEVEGVFHTHCHDDHFAGLTHLLQSDKPIKYFATSLVRSSVTKKLSALLQISESEFSEYFEIHDLEEGEWNDIMGLEVMPTMSPHPVEACVFNFRVLWEKGYKTYAHMADIASFKVLDSMINDDVLMPGLSAERAEEIKARYLLPADVKKIDIGGGAIHGNAEDFYCDTSSKLLLGHISRPLYDIEKRIGSGAPFGTADVLIPGKQNFLLRDANDFLRQYFHNVAPERLNMLLNNEIICFNPETIITPSGAVPADVYLVLSGIVERIATFPQQNYKLYSGSMVAELAVLHNKVTTSTYRSLGFVQALRVPADLYRNFIRQFYSSDELVRLREVEAQIRDLPIFGNGVSSSSLFTLAQKCRITKLQEGRFFDSRNDELHILITGNLVNKLETHFFSLDDLGCWGYDSLFKSMTKQTELTSFNQAKLLATEESTVFSFPLSLISKMPVVRWKLFECFKNSTYFFRPGFRQVSRKASQTLEQKNTQFTVELAM